LTEAYVTRALAAFTVKAHIAGDVPLELAMLSAAIEAFEQIFTPPFRAALWKTIGLTLALLVLSWLALEKLVVSYAAGAPGWLATIISIATGLGLVFVLAYLMAPVSSLVAGFFIDELAERVEANPGPVGKALPAGAAIWIGAKFAAVSLLVNAIALVVFLIPGVNIAVFFLANAYLFGREYFELAALRYRTPKDVAALRRRHALYLFMCGLPIALMVSIPIVNLLTPMFAIAYMARIHQRLAPPRPVLVQPAS
jgi:CysZ protein